MPNALYTYKVVIAVDDGEYGYMSTETTEEKARKQAKQWARDTFPAISRLKIKYVVKLTEQTW